MPSQSPNSSKVAATLLTKVQQAFQLQEAMGVYLGSRPTSKLIHPEVLTWLATAFPSSGFQARIKPVSLETTDPFFSLENIGRFANFFGGNKLFCWIFRVVT